MSTPFGGTRVQVKPPERGVFPLDHDGECRAKMDVRKSSCVTFFHNLLYLGIFELFA